MCLPLRMAPSTMIYCQCLLTTLYNLPLSSSKQSMTAVNWMRHTSSWSVLRTRLVHRKCKGSNWNVCSCLITIQNIKDIQSVLLQCSKIQLFEDNKNQNYVCKETIRLNLWNVWYHYSDQTLIFQSMWNIYIKKHKL